jgi:hypothetical protein
VEVWRAQHSGWHLHGNGGSHSAGGGKIPVRCKVEQEGKSLDDVPWAASARIMFPASYNEFGQSVKLYLARP